MALFSGKPDDLDPTHRLLVEKKRRFTRILVGLAFLVIVGLMLLQTNVLRLGAGVPKTHSILIFALVNVNIVLLFLLFVLVLRNLHKIFFEQGQMMRAQLRTKVVVAFASLSLVPTILLFYAALQFITLGHDYWFDRHVEQSLVDSMALAQYVADLNERFALEAAEDLKATLKDWRLASREDQQSVEKLLREKRREKHLALAQVFLSSGELLAESISQDLKTNPPLPLPPEVLHRASHLEKPESWVDSGDSHELIRVIWPVRGDNHEPLAFLVVGYQTSAPIKGMMHNVKEGLERYRELAKVHDPVRVSHYIALTVVALLIVFASTWIGLHLAKGLTGPIIKLAEATDRIAKGDYDSAIDIKTRDDEIGTLVDSFNRMTRDLKAGKMELTRKNIELMESNAELDQRRRYMEFILQSVAAGVIGVDAAGFVKTINQPAAEIFQLEAEEVLARPLAEVLRPEHYATLSDLVRTAESSSKGSAEKQVKFKIGGRGRSLQFHLNKLKDESGLPLGLVIVFDDLSDLEKTQRMEAWREVARRIAHEIKNPLTPIMLSAQRLRRRYTDRFPEDGQVFDECTSMIMRQVDELKRLVSEFSNFARMPEAEPTPNDLAEIMEKTLTLYREGHKNIEFVFNREPGPFVFNLDREQITRVLINLLDNAVAAVDNHGRIEVSLNLNKALKIVRLEVADDGVGLSPVDKGRLFEPYYSTKKAGTGLGLAIVSTIVADHGGFVRVQDNHPRGARFIIELPLRS